MKLRFWLIPPLFLLGGAGIVVLYLWVQLLSPFGFEYPEEMAPQATESGYHKVFVYGTLRFAPVRWVVKGRVGETESHTLSGYRRTGLDLQKDPDSEVEGYLLRVSSEELRRLDRYERLGLRYERRLVQLEDSRQAWVYQRLD